MCLEDSIHNLNILFANPFQAYHIELAGNKYYRDCHIKNGKKQCVWPGKLIPDVLSCSSSFQEDIPHESPEIKIIQFIETPRKLGVSLLEVLGCGLEIKPVE